MKTILKLVGGLLAGCAIGALVGMGAAVVFGEKSWAEVWAKFCDIGTLRLLLPALGSVVGAVVAFILHIIIHEGGHLVAGLLTGYRFVSFRIFSLTLIRKDGRYQWRNFSLGGTGGQCLMAPPLRPLEEIDTRWYNLGGVLANVVVSTLALVLLLCFDLPDWAEIFLMTLTFFGYLLALINGIPMKLSGVNNDGYNLLFLEKTPDDKRRLCQMLEANANIQNGIQPKEMPDEMFPAEEQVNWKDGLQVNWQLMVVARLENQHRWEEAYALLQEGLAQKQHIAALFQQELTLEMVFVCLVTGRIEEARQLYTDRLRKYVKQFMKTHSSKQRIHFATTLLLDGNREEALQLLEDLKAHRTDYLLQGEVEMDIELMEHLLSVELRVESVEL